jgi:hypothetical protein
VQLRAGGSAMTMMFAAREAPYDLWSGRAMIASGGGSQTSIARSLRVAIGANVKLDQLL